MGVPRRGRSEQSPPISGGRAAAAAARATARDAPNADSTRSASHAASSDAPAAKRDVCGNGRTAAAAFAARAARAADAAAHGRPPTSARPAARAALGTTPRVGGPRGRRERCHLLLQRRHRGDNVGSTAAYMRATIGSLHGASTAVRVGPSPLNADSVGGMHRVYASPLCRSAVHSPVHDRRRSVACARMRRSDDLESVGLKSISCLASGPYLSCDHVSARSCAQFQSKHHTLVRGRCRAKRMEMPCRWELGRSDGRGTLSITFGRAPRSSRGVRRRELAGRT